MVYMRKWVAKVNDVTSPGRDEEFNPGLVADLLSEVDSLADAFERFGLVSAIDERQQPYLRAFLESIPPGLSAAMLAAARDAFARGARVQISWQPGYDFELRAWESDPGGGFGLLNLHLLSPHPPEADLGADSA